MKSTLKGEEDMPTTVQKENIDRSLTLSNVTGDLKLVEKPLGDKGAYENPGICICI